MMILENDIGKQIYDIKKLVSEIDDHSNDSVFFRKLSQQAQELANNIDRIHYGYYVAYVEIVLDNIPDKSYYPLGFMTQYEAYRILDEELDPLAEPWDENGIIEVSKEIYDKYYDLMKMKELYDHIIRNKSEMNAILPLNFMEDLKAKIDKLRSDLGFTHDWQHICRKPIEF